MAQRVLWTIGHSTHTQEQLVELLRHNNIRTLVDVRTIPKSSRNPQFNKDELTEVLPQQYGINYVWMGKELGGLRKRNKELHVNEGWENLSFRGYADYMQTREFEDGVQQLKQLAATQGPAAIMCAEAVYFSCHRRLISDALTVSGWTVWHIMPQPGKPPQQHTLTQFAKVDGSSITYPAYAATKTPAKKQAARKASSKTTAIKTRAAKAPAAHAEAAETSTDAPNEQQQGAADDLSQAKDAQHHRPVTRAVARASKQLKIEELMPRRSKEPRNG